jgi:putative transposase
VEHLLSPPYTPAYNGSIEAGIGSLKTRAHHESARHDRPGHWTCDDIEAARRQGNDLARPFGPSRPTPSTAWTSREPVSDLLRTWFRTRCRQHRQEIESDPTREPAGDPAQSAAADARLAVTRTLSESSLLQVRRRRITSPKRRPRSAKIT